ncbi:unnamed protein product [Parascedosporium putredinis]|uniref:DUF7514 domain-containing protein n=1 Tax=Parascedosporium putredinis TaxID=1442378 RepID=A0A9P1H5T1_9PEZI|nr:unnamed protein product [Parascedosporium putredinis]CAI7999627.1 unnamed protein product [Parascedosporium putredinis]
MTPAMCEEMRKLVDAGGLEGLKRKIVEEGNPGSLHAPDSPIDSSQSDGLSIVDRRWGELFDKNGNATPRLGQVLRGIAKYLISEVSPAESVVISPAKLANFYREYSVDNEPHCFSDIFKCRDDSKEEYRNIAELFEDLECDYHLIKATPTSRPIVPALTPAGFAKWTIMAIFAYPDVEAKRLDCIMSQLPIDADGPFVDGKPERLPKQLSRYLLPSKADKSARSNFKIFVDDFFQDRESRQRAAEKSRRHPSDGFSSSKTPAQGGNQDSVAKKDYPGAGPARQPRDERRGRARTSASKVSAKGGQRHRKRWRGPSRGLPPFFGQSRPPLQLDQHYRAAVGPHQPGASLEAEALAACRSLRL